MREPIMTAVATVDTGEVEILREVPIPTWFGVGGAARRLAHPASVAQLMACLKIDAGLLVLGDGANLLVADEGVGPLVVVLDRGEFVAQRLLGPDGGMLEGGHELVRVGAGAKLPQTITWSHRLGLVGLEVLGGIPATLGGAAVMNAGGAFGQISDMVHAVTVLTRGGALVEFGREELRFGYRRAEFGGILDGAGAVVVAVTLALRRAASGDELAAARAKLIEVMEYKKSSQPMAAQSAGCAFKNPTLAATIEGIGAAGARVSAGMLIDRAGCKGLRLGCAEVSERHGNFITARLDLGVPGRADDVVALMRLVRSRVAERFGVSLEPEVVLWSASGRDTLGS